MRSEEHTNNNENMAVGEHIKYNHDYKKTKIEEVRKKLQTLVEKVKCEGWILDSEEGPIKSDSLTETLSDSFIGPNLEMYIANTSESSGYSSDLNQSSISSLSVTSEGSCLNFSDFVDNFLKNHSEKERLNLLQFHSNKRISLNMMKHCLEDVSSQCSKELRLIEKSLCHLNRLAAEFSVNIENSPKNIDCRKNALAYRETNDNLHQI